MKRLRKAAAILGLALALTVPATAGKPGWVNDYRTNPDITSPICLTAEYARVTMTLRDAEMVHNMIMSDDDGALRKMQETNRLFRVRPDVKVHIVRTLRLNYGTMHEFRFEGMTDTAFINDAVKDCHK